MVSWSAIVLSSATLARGAIVPPALSVYLMPKRVQLAGITLIEVLHQGTLSVTFGFVQSQADPDHRSSTGDDSFPIE
jgi:hypothetical protein